MHAIECILRIAVFVWFLIVCLSLIRIALIVIAIACVLVILKYASSLPSRPHTAQQTLALCQQLVKGLLERMYKFFFVYDDQQRAFATNTVDLLR